ncbi:MAG TPA: TetR/AcrR family transcriptional regulator [Nocardioides sp.]
MPDEMPAKASEPRERLLRTAADLFYREGIKGVGVDRVLSEAGVTRATMYRHFAGKEALVAAYLDLEDATIKGYFATAEAAGGPPKELLERVIEGIAEDARRYHNRGCPFINAAAEYGDPDSVVRRIVRRHRDWFRSALVAVAGAAGTADPDRVAAALVLLRDAALVGVYLDDEDEVVETFTTTARSIAGLP